MQERLEVLPPSTTRRIIAVTQIRLHGLGQAYYQRRRAQGDTTMEALRALKRRLARIVFNLLRPTDQLAAAPLPQAA